MTRRENKEQTHVLVVDINAIRCQSLQSLKRLLLLVVETSIETQLLSNEVQLLVISNTSNNGQPLVLGQLTDNLTDSSTSSRDEDCLTLLRRTDLIQRAVSRQARHSQSTGEDLGVELVRVVQDAISIIFDFLGSHSTVLLHPVARSYNNVSSFEGWVVRFDDADNGAVVNRLPECVRRGV